MKIHNIFDFNDAPRQGSAPFERPDVAFRRDMLQHGFTPPSDLKEGSIFRFAVDGDKGTEKSGWGVFFPDGVAAGEYGNWKTGEAWTWCAKSEAAMDYAELSAHRARMDRARVEREKEQERLHAAASARAAKEWSEATEATEHPYLISKGVKSYGLRIHQGRLLIPMGDMESLQKIGADGQKRFLPGGKKKGLWFEIKGSERLCIVEGYATGATIREATGWTVFVAFDAGNLKPVAERVRALNPTSEIIIAGDDDQWTEGNPGRTKAMEAAEAISARAIFPVFATPEKGRTDWNDLAKAEGIEAVKLRIAGQRERTVTILEWSAKRYRGVPAPQKQWLVEGTMPRGDVFLLAAMGGAGKGILTLDLALQVAAEPREGIDLAPPSAFGNKILTHGPVVILTAEDDNDEVHRRIEALGRPIPDRLYILPLPDITGPMPLIVPGRSGPELAPAWFELEEQLLDLNPVLINFDPMASFVMADVNADPAVGQFTMGLLAHLGKRTLASILIAHHMAKTSVKVETPEQVRSLIRGTTAIVDGARGAYALWASAEKEAKDTCKWLGVPFSRGKVYKGCLVKNNFPGDSEIKTYLRNESGLLEVVNDRIRVATADNRPVQLDVLEAYLHAQAAKGKPLTARGNMGVWENNEILPPVLKGVSKHQMGSLIKELLESGRVVKASAQGSKVKQWLCAPGDAFSEGNGTIVPGDFE